MASTFIILATLYLPALVSALSFTMLFRIKQRRDAVVTVQPFGLFGISVPVSSIVVSRILVCISAVGFLGLYAFLDFSVLFPKHLQMEVFFDEPGISRTLKEYFLPVDLENLGILRDYASHRQTYFDGLDVEARKVLGKERFFSLSDGSVHSTGETSFIVQKIDGWQRYHIQESKGELLHTLEAPHHSNLTFYTLFEKLPTADDYVTPSFTDLVIRRRVILRPKFKQLLAEDRTSKSVTFKLAVIGATSVTPFPWPSFSPTVYCAELPTGGLVPIAYSVYR